MKKFSLITLIILATEVLLSQTVTIGTGTSTQRYPLGGYWGYERSASIYTSAEIGTTGNIISIAWYPTFSSSTGRPMKIYLKHTTSSTLSASTWSSLISGATLVYDGNTGSITANTWNTYSLSTTFAYSGGTNNLLVLVETNCGGSGCGTGSTNPDCRYSSVSNTHQYWTADNSPPTGNGTVSSYRPNIQLVFGSNCSGSPVAGTASVSNSTVCSGSPSTLILTGYTAAIGINLQWQTGPSATGPWSDISGATSNNYVVNPTSTTYYRCVVTCSFSGQTSFSNVVVVNVSNCYLISNPSTVTLCSGIFYDSGGSTGQYGNSEDYTKTFVASTPGSALQFTFNSFNTEASYDYLYVYDGGTTSAPQVAGSPFHGTTIPGPITANSDSLTFRFTSDGSTTRDGWEAVISCVPITPPNCVTYGDPANGATGICPGSVTLNWTAPTSGFKPQGYKLYFGTNNPPTNIHNGLNIGNVTSYQVTNLAANTVYYWRIEPYNSGGSNTGCAVRNFTTANVAITSTNSPVTTCQNTASLSATGSGTINWYNVATGGVPIATGSPYMASFNGNTTYYVSASQGSPTNYTVGKPSWVSSDGYFGTSNWGIRFTTYVPLTINSVNVYVQTAGSTVVIKLQDNNGTDLNTYTFNSCPSGLNTLTLNCVINTPGDYRLVSGNTTSLGRDWTGISFPYTVPGVISLTSSEWGGSTTGTYYFFYNWSVTANGSCESARVPVIVNHTASPITITPSGPTTFMVGGSVGLTASSSASPAYTYTWSPATGLNTTSGANVIASPTTTTTYTVTGSNGSCSYSQQITITVLQPCTGLGTGVVSVPSLPYTHNSQTTCGKVNDITSSNAVVCGSSSYYTGEDVVYSFTPTISGNVTITLTSTGTYTGLMLYEGCPMLGQGGICVASSQSSTGNKSLCVYVNAGSTYYLIIDSYASPACNPYSLSISAPDPTGSLNDLPCNASTIAIGGIELGDNTCAGGSNEPVVPSCWTSGNLNTLWWKFVAPASGSVKIKTILGTLAFTQIAVYQGACNSLTMVTGACNQDAPGVCSGTTNNSALTLTGLTPGNTYYIRVDGESDDVGTFQLQVIDGTQNWPTVPQQDCAAATQVCNQQTVVGDPGFTGAGTTCDYTTPYGCFTFGTQNNTAWYTIPVNANGTLAFEIIPNLSSTDYDWALWLVNPNLSTTCSQIASGTAPMVRCNFSATSGTTGLRTGYSGTSETAGGPPFCAPLSVTNGQVYLLLIWNWSGNNTGFTLDMFSSPINYSTPTSVTWTGGASTDWFNPVNWGGCAIPSCSIDAIVVNGPTNQPVINANGAACKSISIQSGASLTINAGRQLQVCQDFLNYGTLNLDPTSTILMNNGSVTQNLNGSLTGTNKLGNFTITKTGGSVVANQDIDIGGNLTTSNATSVFNTNGKYIKVAGNISLSSPATYSGYGTTGALEFYGTSAQTVSAGGTFNVNHVVVNNSSGGVTLNNDMSLSPTGVLTLTEGKLNTGTNRVIVQNPDPISVNTGSALSYINGNLRRYWASNTGVYNFPVGTSTAYRLAQIINNNLTGITYIDGFFTSTFSNTGSLDPAKAVDGGTPYSSVASEGIWQLTPNASPTGGSYSINLWFNGGGANAFTGLTDNAFGPLKRPNGSTSAFDWTALGGTLNASGTLGRTVAGGYARRNNWTTFSEYAIGKSTFPLPVELIYFKATCDNYKVILEWETASESSNLYFLIERSADLISYESIGIVQGSYNTNEIHKYFFEDYLSNISSASILYYRLNQIDFDGKVHTYNPIQAICNVDEEGSIVITNNEASDEILIFLNGKKEGNKYIIKMLDNIGRQFFYKEIVNDLLNDGIIKINKTGLSKGLYYLNIYSDYCNKTEKIIIH